MAGENNFKSTVESLFKGMDGFITTKTVVGDPITVDDLIILPLVDVSFGVGAGAVLNGDKKKNNAGGGMGGKITPSAVLVLQNGVARMVNVKSDSGMAGIVAKVPDFIERFTSKKKNAVSKETAETAETMEEKLED